MTTASSDYVIYITTKGGRTWSHLKEENGWTRTGPNGRIHPLRAEQLLSHLLPPLAADQPGLSVRVEGKGLASSAPLVAPGLPSSLPQARVS